MTSHLHLGSALPLSGTGEPGQLYLPSHHLLTHGVVVGMTGSGKTGLVTVLVEEALRAQVPTLVIDVKGDLPNLLLAFPSFSPSLIEPWIDPLSDASPHATAERLAKLRRHRLAESGIAESDLVSFHERTVPRVITPGADGGELLHVLSSLERRGSRWDTDLDGARSALSAGVSLILRLIGKDPDPARSREHVLLSVLAENRLRAGRPADLASLLPEIVLPPISTIGALEMNAFLSKKARAELAASLNTLLASPSFTNWREGATLDVDSWMRPVDGKTPVTILSVAHLDDEERKLVLGVVLEEVLAWMRGLQGTSSLRALIVFDEIYGFLPPHPASPPTKKPLVALMKQARAFGVGVVVATQNPMDLDYRALSNAGLWCIGRLQTDADRNRVVESLAQEAGFGASQKDFSHVLKQLNQRWFVVRDVHSGIALVQPRWTMSFLRGPMTRAEIKRARVA